MGMGTSLHSTMKRPETSPYTQPPFSAFLRGGRKGKEGIVPSMSCHDLKKIPASWGLHKEKNSEQQAIN